MTRSPLDLVIEKLEQLGRPVKHSGDQVNGCCPAHNDQTPSLSVRYDRPGGKVLLRCHVGCDPAEVVAALGLTWSDMFDPKEEGDRIRRQEIAAAYDYTAADGTVLFQQVRMGPKKTFWTRHPDGRGGWIKGRGDVKPVLFLMHTLGPAIAAGETIRIPEGEKDVMRLVALGLVATCNPNGAGKWDPSYSEALRGAHVAVIADNDDTGYAHARKIAADLDGKAASVRVVRGQVDHKGADVSDHLDAGYTIDDLIPVIDGATTSPRPLPGGTDISGQLSRVHETYRRWFGAGYDLGALDCILAAAAAERLGGDPVWILVVGGSGAAKTETIMPLGGAGAVTVSTLNGEAALLSGTSKKDRAKDATGGLLRKIGEHGILVVKDVTSILSMNRDTRAAVLAALREIYDGQWSRNVGTDGGQTLTWKGRLVVVGAVTTAWDAAHTVIATMGDRFVLVRIDSSLNRQSASRQAMRNVDSEKEMRDALTDVVGALINQVDPDQQITLTEDEISNLFQVADLVTRARTAVERDYQGDPLFAHALEMPTRFAKQLSQVLRGAVAVGIAREAAMAAALRCAGDSMPPLRLQILIDLADNPASLTKDVVKRTQLPRKTVDRALQELHLLGLLEVEDQTYGQTVRWAYTLADDEEKANLAALAALKAEKLARNVSTPGQQAGPRQEPVQFQGTCTGCGQTLMLVRAGRTQCERCRLAARAAG